MYMFSFSAPPSVQLILPLWQKTVNRIRNAAENRGGDTPSDTPKTPSAISTEGSAATYEKGDALRLIQYEHLVEMIGKIGIPVIFGLSNVVYWSYYLS